MAKLSRIVCKSTAYVELAKPSASTTGHAIKVDASDDVTLESDDRTQLVTMTQLDRNGKLLIQRVPYSALSQMHEFVEPDAKKAPTK